MTAERTLRLLVVCTANICRSPMAQALLAEHARRADVAVEVRSAGVSDRPRTVDPNVVKVLAERELAPTKDQSSSLDASLVEWADLIVTMTGQQALEVGGRFRRALPRVFVLDHLVQIATPIEGDVAMWLDRLRKSPRRYPAHPGVVDVDDPYGERIEVFREVAERLDTLAGRLIETVFDASIAR